MTKQTTIVVIGSLRVKVWANSGDDKLTFSYFPRSKDLILNANCLHWEKIKIKWRLLKYLPTMLIVKFVGTQENQISWSLVTTKEYLHLQIWWFPFSAALVFLGRSHHQCTRAVLYSNTSYRGPGRTLYSFVFSFAYPDSLYTHGSLQLVSPTNTSKNTSFLSKSVI